MENSRFTLPFQGVPVRLSLAIMIFFATWGSYMLRINISLAIVDMTEKVVPTIHIDPECRGDMGILFGNHTFPDIQERQDWNQLLVGYILSVYFWGYTVTQVTGHTLAVKFGARMIVGWSLLLASIMTIVTPLSAQIHFGCLMIVRILLGAFSGVLYPALHVCFRKWVPPLERNAFTWSYLGSTVGTLITWPICGIIVERTGWQVVFYFTGGLVAFWGILWFYLVADSPEKHPRISIEERNYIVRSINEARIPSLRDVQSAGGSTYPARKRRVIPWRQIAESAPVRVLVVLHFCNAWGLNFLLIDGPIYMRNVLGYSPTAGGILAGVPYITRLSAGFVFSSLGNHFQQRQIGTITSMRKGFTIFSHLIPGTFMFVLSWVGCRRTVAVSMIIISFAFSGASVGGVMANATDLSPRYAGVLSSIVDCMGSTTGIFIPIVVGALTMNSQEMKHWQTVFLINSAMYVFGAILYLCWGSGQLQPWDTPAPRIEEEIASTSYNSRDSNVYNEPNNDNEE